MADRPSFPVPDFPDFASDLAARFIALAQASGADIIDDDDDQDRYNGPQTVGMILRPAVHVSGRTVAWRLATAAEVREWRATWPDWWEMVCVCGHTRRQHSTAWSDDDEPIGLRCDECDCTDIGADDD